MKKKFKTNSWVFHMSGAECNACSSEASLCWSPLFDIEKYGIMRTHNPRQANILLITGDVNEKNMHIFKNVKNHMAKPCIVAIAGTCACSGNIFKLDEDEVSKINDLMPVDVFISGCPPRPQAFIDGLIMASQKYHKLINKSLSKQKTKAVEDKNA